MHDPRMQNLFDEEGPRGIGTYWIIIEKLSLLPDAKAQLKYLRSSTNKKLSQLPTFRSWRGRILQSRRTESAEKEGEKNSKKW